MWRLGPPLELDSPKRASALLADFAHATARASLRDPGDDVVVSAALGGFVLVWRAKRARGFVPRPVFAARVLEREHGSCVRGAFVTPGLALALAFAGSAGLVAGAPGLTAAALPSALLFLGCRFVSARLLPADEPLVLARVEAATLARPAHGARAHA